MRTHHEAKEPNPGRQALDQGLREHAAGLAHLVLEGDEGEGEEEYDGEGNGEADEDGRGGCGGGEQHGGCVVWEDRYVWIKVELWGCSMD